jgi:outer membrane immunogenic protein
MRKAAIGIALVAAIIGMPAFAADMAVKVPPPAPTPVFSWNGFYVGGNIGGSWGTARNSLSILQPEGFGIPGIFGLTGTDSSRLPGVIGGAQIGYNWQTPNFLVGIEADFQGSGQKGSGAYTSTINLLNGAGLGPNAVNVTDNSRLDWFGTFRGRLGIASGRWLMYATGGLAYGEANQSGNAQPANLFPGTTFNAPFVWDHSTVKAGWTIGAGVENAIAANWSWKIEYLYVDLGSVTANASGGIGNFGPITGNCYGAPGGFGCTGANGTPQGGMTSRFTDNILRVGLNYQFH